jgi:hypothetical protein
MIGGRAVMRSRSVNRQAAFAILLTGLIALGCRSADRPIAVGGKVTFQGEAVTEGTVQFNDDKTGRGTEVDLGPDGSYQARLPAGVYTVIILPPQMMESKSGPPDPQFKKVANIPNKYRSTRTSGLTAAVSADTTVHDFDMKP